MFWRYQKENNMHFHHLGIATKDINKALSFLQNNFTINDISPQIYDPLQDATLQLIYTPDMTYELVTGNVVERFIKSHTTYYHTCYETSNIHESIKNFQGAMVISPPKEAVLFSGRLVAFLMTPLGLVELLNEH